MSFPAEHYGTVKKRIWYKVRWTAGEHKGLFDLMLKSTFDQHKTQLELLETIEAKECVVGLPVGFGKSEQEVNDWIAQNKK